MACFTGTTVVTTTATKAARKPLGQFDKPSTTSAATQTDNRDHQATNRQTRAAKEE